MVGDELQGDPSQAQETSSKISKEKRKELLAQAVQTEVVGGGRIESQSEFSAVAIHGKKVNHVLHLLISLFTVGAWSIVWLVLALTGGEKRTMVSVDEFGNILKQRV